MNSILDQNLGNEDEFAPELASIGTRFVASFIDGILVGIVNLAINYALGLIESPISYVINFAIGIAYFGYFESSEKQATLGKQMMGIIVVQDETGEPLGSKAYTRAAVRVVSGLIIGIGFLMAFFNDNRQTLHDKVAGSLVVKG